MASALGNIDTFAVDISRADAAIDRGNVREGSGRVAQNLRDGFLTAAEPEGVGPVQVHREERNLVLVRPVHNQLHRVAHDIDPTLSARTQLPRPEHLREFFLVFLRQELGPDFHRGAQDTDGPQITC